jgi:hypothetical protein
MEHLKSESCAYRKIVNNKVVCINELYVYVMKVIGEKEKTNKISNKIKNNFKISKSRIID